MREIKFRAWHKIDKYWIEHDKLFQSGHTYQNPFSNSDLELLQFTGLKDKNGKEIYEGDVVCFKEFFMDSDEDEKDLIGEIYFESGAFLINRKRQIHMFIWEESDIKDMEIIGNIYENPELLKP